MKIIKQIFKGTTAVLSFSLLSVANISLADTSFRPSKLEVTFYEMGFRNSTTGSFASIFKSSTGQLVDLSSNNSVQTLADNVTLSDSGTYDQIYALVANKVSLAGDAGNGCYIKAGDYSYNDGDWGSATTNSALAGTANATETGFGGNDASVGNLSSRKVIPAVTSSVNGEAVSNLTLYLVNSITRNPGEGGSYDRYLYLGDMQSSINLDVTKEGTLWIDADTSESVELNTGCTNANWVNTKFGLSIEQ